MTAAGPRRPAVRRLAPGVERAWGMLRDDLAVRDECRLAFVFGLRPDELAEFVARCTDLARGREARVDVLAVPGPGAVTGVVDELCRPAARPSATWLDVTDPAAVVPLLRRLDSHHDVVVRARPAALVVAAPAGTREVVTAGAPGTWSRRSLSVDLQDLAGGADVAAPDGPRIVLVGHALTVDLVVPADRSAARSAAPRIPSGEPAALAPAVDAPLRRAAAAVGRGLRGEALAAAREALAAASRPEDRGPAHGWLALALDLDDPDEPADEAEAHAQAVLAITSGVALGPELTGALLDLLEDLPYPEVDPAVAHAVVGHRLARLAADGPAAQRDLAAALDWLGRLDDPRPAATELLGVARRFHAALGDTPRTLEDLADALDRSTERHAIEGRLDEARTTAAEALDLRRRLRVLLGDTEETLSALLTHLAGITDLHRDDGALDDALATAAELVDVARRHYEVTGDPGLKYPGLGRCLRTLAGLQREAGHLPDALATATELVDLHRRCRRPDGRPRDPFRFPADLDRLVALQHASGRLDDALATASEALDHARRKHAAVLDVVPFEDHPDAARPVVAALDRLADVQSDAGRRAEAAASAAEALDLRRRVHAALGEPPDGLPGLSVAADRLGLLLLERGDPGAARPVLVEALGFDRLRRERSGRDPAVLHDLRLALVRVAALDEDAGDPERARALYREALEVDRVLREEFGPPHWTEAPDLTAAAGRLLGRSGGPDPGRGSGPARREAAPGGPA